MHFGEKVESYELRINKFVAKARLLAAPEIIRKIFNMLLTNQELKSSRDLLLLIVSHNLNRVTTAKELFSLTAIKTSFRAVS